MCDDYFCHAYGSAGPQARAYLQKVSDTFDFSFVSGEKTTDPKRGDHYDPDRAEVLAQVKELAEVGRRSVEENRVMPLRCQTLSMRLLLRHAEYCELWGQILWNKAMGYNFKAQELAKEFCHVFGKYEMEIERYYDHSLACRVLEHITRKPQGIILD